MNSDVLELTEQFTAGRKSSHKRPTHRQRAGHEDAGILEEAAYIEFVSASAAEATPTEP